METSVTCFSPEQSTNQVAGIFDFTLVPREGICGRKILHPGMVPSVRQSVAYSTTSSITGASLRRPMRTSRGCLPGAISSGSRKFTSKRCGPRIGAEKLQICHRTARRPTPRFHAGARPPRWSSLPAASRCGFRATRFTPSRIDCTARNQGPRRNHAQRRGRSDVRLEPLNLEPAATRWLRARAESRSPAAMPGCPADRYKRTVPKESPTVTRR